MTVVRSKNIFNLRAKLDQDGNFHELEKEADPDITCAGWFDNNEREIASIYVRSNVIFLSFGTNHFPLGSVDRFDVSLEEDQYEIALSRSQEISGKVSDWDERDPLPKQWFEDAEDTNFLIFMKNIFDSVERQEVFIEVNGDDA